MAPGTKKFVIFYSWESDLPPECGRKLVEDALEGAAKALSSDDSISIDPLIDRDTLGVAGSPNIFATILQKIEDADAVFADVSIITPPDAVKSTPNPNVLIELGYAVRAKGWSRVVLVMNAHFGKPEKLPFDLRGQRALVFNSPPGDPHVDSARGQLQADVEAALREMLRNLPPDVGEVITPPVLRDEALKVSSQRAETEDRLYGVSCESWPSASLRPHPT